MACEKLHNARAIVQDLENPAVGQAVFERFNGGRDGTLAYYHSLAHVFATRDVAVAGAFDNAEIRKASRRERVCQYVKISVVDGSLQETQHTHNTDNVS